MTDPSTDDQVLVLAGANVVRGGVDCVQRAREKVDDSSRLYAREAWPLVVQDRQPCPCPGRQLRECGCGLLLPRYCREHRVDVAGIVQVRACDSHSRV